MRLLFTSTYFYPYISGVTVYPLIIATHFSNQHIVSVLTFQHRSFTTFRTSLTLSLQTEQYNGIKIQRIPVHLRISKGLVNFFYPIISLLKVKNNDIIFINLPQFEGFFPAIWGKLLGKKVYAIYHCELWFEKGFLLKLIALLTNFSAFLTCLFATKIIAYTEDYALHSSVLKHFLKKVIYTLPPVEKVQPDKSYLPSLKSYLPRRQAGLLNHSPIIGFSGRISREKGLDILLDSLHLMNNHSFRKFLILCAGPYGTDVVGEKTYYDHLQQRIIQEQLPVIFLGKLTPAQLATFYSVIDLLVLPSTNKTEAFGLVQIEAMLAGKPVIASDIPGVRVPIKLTKMGALTIPGNANNLAQTIASILQNKNNYHRKKDTAARIFNINKTYKFYDVLLK